MGAHPVCLGIGLGSGVVDQSQLGRPPPKRAWLARIVFLSSRTALSFSKRFLRSFLAGHNGQEHSCKNCRKKANDQPRKIPDSAFHFNCLTSLVILLLVQGSLLQREVAEGGDLGAESG